MNATRNAFIVPPRWHHFSALLSRLCSPLVALVLLFAPVAWAEEASNAVRNVEATTTSGGRVLVRVTLAKPLSATPSGFVLAAPPRIALDLPDTANASGQNRFDAGVGALTSVNVVQAGARTRLVLNLSQSAEYNTRLDGNTLLISLEGNTASSTPVNVNPVFAEASPTTAKHGVRDVDFRRGPAGEGRVVVSLSDVKTGINVRRQSDKILIDFIDTDLPRALRRKLDVADFGTPVQVVESYVLGGNTRMVIQPRGTWEYSAYQTDNNFIIEVKPTTDGDKKTADGKKRYTGEKLSLNFQNVEVRSVLQVIADFTGLNIVASDTVTGNLTLRLKDVPWDQALDLIMQTKGLDKRENGNVMLIAPKDELVAKEKLEFEAKNQVVELAPLVTEYIQLNYLRADEAQVLLNGGSLSGANSGVNSTADCSTEASSFTATPTTQTSAQSGNAEQKILTKRGRVSFELKTNTLIINDTAAKIQEVRELLSKLDVPTRQVQIEARVVIADDGFSRQLGVRLNANRNTTNDRSSGRDVSLGGGFDLPARSDAPPGSILLSLFNSASGNLLDLELQALQADNRGSIISNPRVVTSNQKPAVILQGTRVPIVTPGVDNGPPTVRYEEVLLCLLVDPQILNNDSVILNVEVQKDSIGAAANEGNPFIDTKRVKTQVRVANGETAVLGGIFEKISRDDVLKIPFFGDLPFIGNLFKSTDRQDAKLELLIFITPRTMDDRMSLR